MLPLFYEAVIYAGDGTNVIEGSDKCLSEES